MLVLVHVVTCGQVQFVQGRAGRQNGRLATKVGRLYLPVSLSVCLSAWRCWQRNISFRIFPQPQQLNDLPSDVQDVSRAIDDPGNAYLSIALIDILFFFIVAIIISLPGACHQRTATDVFRVGLPIYSPRSGRGGCRIRV